MSTQSERLVRIEKGNVQKSVSEADFKHRKMAGLGGNTYEGDGWKVVSFEDGTPYDAGEPATKYGLHAAARASAIGVDGSSPTDVDGNTVDEGYVASVGSTLASTPVEAPKSSRATAPAPTPEPASAPPTE
jgi:hypothetical protein